MPVFNAERFVEQAITSILEQSYDNLELLIIDDGSNDDTWKKISQLQQLNKKEILGIKFSRNFGHQNAVIAG